MPVCDYITRRAVTQYGKEKVFMRRANGTGTVVRLSGNRRRPYAVRVSERDKYGQIVQKAIGYFATAREAQEALDEHNRLKAQGLAPAINQMNMTVGQVYEAWSARAYAKVGPQASRGYVTAWKMRISRFADRKRTYSQRRRQAP